ncbi:MAG: hypothetical protein Q9200_006392 [Gallowayella weberi]
MLETRRLYVSPLNPDLLSVVLSGPLRAIASNISYHTLQAHADKPYGYLNLPANEADRLQKKFHGSILRGVKMKVQKARPEKVWTPSENVEEGSIKKNEKENKQRRRSKPENGVLAGVELPDERRIKRGWTDPNAKKEKKTLKRGKPEEKDTVRRASAHTDKPECLFKAKLPPNAVANVATDPSGASKSKKRKRGESERNFVVHEFDKTTRQASFLREEKNSKAGRLASSYAEGKGWLDQDGNLVEEAKEVRRVREKGDGAGAQSAQGIQTRSAGRPDMLVGVDEHVQAVKEGSRSNDRPRAAIGRKAVLPRRENPQLAEQSDEASADETSSEATASSKSGDEVNTDQVRALSISRLSPTPPLASIKEVHPLEALFKRPQTAASQTPRKPSLEVKTGFSFFEPDDGQAVTTTVTIPQTPFTQQDIQERRLRSAAPTPDTAAPSKTSFGRVWSRESTGNDSVNGEEDEEEEEEDASSTPVASAASVQKEAEGEAEESEFAKWFYEHRGETNRAWKRRRREAAKEKRQKENKKG